MSTSGCLRTRFHGLPFYAEMGMDDVRSREIEDLRLDIKTLRALIDAAAANGVDPNDALLRACANTLYDRHSRLEAIMRDHDQRSAD